MNEALALIRFPGGELRIAYVFHPGTILLAPLFLVEDAPLVLSGGVDHVLECVAELRAMGGDFDDLEEVDIWIQPSNSLHWRGLASPSRAALVDGTDPYGFGADAGLPAEAIRDLHQWTPDWVPLALQHERFQARHRCRVSRPLRSLRP